MTYEYICKSCKHEFSVEQSIKDNVLTDCPECKEKSLQRLISSNGAFILNGSGWAKDGYK